MPKFITQNLDRVHPLRLDTPKRVLKVSSKRNHLLFNSAFTVTKQLYFRRIIKIAAEFSPVTLDKIRYTAYLYSQRNAQIDGAATCEFKIFRVNQTGWTEELVYTASGAYQGDGRFFAEVPVSTLSSMTLDSADIMMIEASVVRLGDTYRDRVYVNHLGVYDSIVRLRNEVDFLGITKQDL